MKVPSSGAVPSQGSRGENSGNLGGDDQSGSSASSGGQAEGEVGRTGVGGLPPSKIPPSSTGTVHDGQGFIERASDGLEVSKKRKDPDGSRSPTPERGIQPSSPQKSIIKQDIKPGVAGKHRELRALVSPRISVSSAIIAKSKMAYMAERLRLHDIKGDWNPDAISQIIAPISMTLRDILGAQPNSGGRVINRPPNSLILNHPAINVLERYPRLTRASIEFSTPRKFSEHEEKHLHEMLGIDRNDAGAIVPPKWYLEAMRSLLLANPSPEIWGGLQIVKMGKIVNGVAEMKPVSEQIVRFDTINLIVVTFDTEKKRVSTFFRLDPQPKRNYTREQTLALHQQRINTFFSQTVSP